MEHCCRLYVPSYNPYGVRFRAIVAEKNGGYIHTQKK